MEVTLTPAAYARLTAYEAAMTEAAKAGDTLLLAHLIDAARRTIEAEVFGEREPDGCCCIGRSCLGNRTLP